MKKASLLTRLKAKKRNKSMLIGITWYTEKNWAQVKSTALDPTCFEDSFNQWEAMAIQARRELQRSGVCTIEFHIDAQAFFDWCTLYDKPNIAASRAEYVSEKLSAANASPSSA